MLERFIERLPGRSTIAVIVWTALIFTIFLLIGFYIIGKGFIFSKIKNKDCDRKDMFSQEEKRFYRALDKVLKENYGDKYIICPQVRLADLFNIRIEDDDDSYYNVKIQGHVDFLLVEREDLTPVLGIELNGPSHHGYSQKIADEWKKKLFDESGEDDNKLRIIVFWTSEMGWKDEEWEFFKKKLAGRIDTALMDIKNKKIEKEKIKN